MKKILKQEVLKLFGVLSLSIQGYTMYMQGARL
jgi:hypothetical protein